MKKVRVYIVLASMFLLLVKVQSQEKYYYASDNNKRFISEVSSKFVISFDNQYLEEVQTSLQKQS